MKIISNFYQGTIKFMDNHKSYEIHYSFLKNADNVGEIEIDMAYIDEQDFTETLDTNTKKAIIYLIKENL